ncbi:MULTISPECIES: hypothetical protein [Microbacterium]|uniref:hypothetical protein n=1 Tax=Microbacterium TaxID=33882 RepID=UPI0010F46E04|nr:hypothetical protein [Microbacterium sp. 4NA327F11]MCK9917007.1 hypothetical protein [Microbacteriaceae bacterium K1510]
MQPHDLRDQQLVPKLPGGRGPRFRSPVSAGGEEPHLGVPHHAADELDPETTTHPVNERDHLDERRPSSVAKNTLADRRISFALSNSAIYFFNRLISAWASLEVPG